MTYVMEEMRRLMLALIAEQGRPAAPGKRRF